MLTKAPLAHLAQIAQRLVERRADGPARCFSSLPNRWASVLRVHRSRKLSLVCCSRGEGKYSADSSSKLVVALASKNPIVIADVNSHVQRASSACCGQGHMEVKAHASAVDRQLHQVHIRAQPQSGQQVQGRIIDRAVSQCLHMRGAPERCGNVHPDTARLTRQGSIAVLKNDLRQRHPSFNRNPERWRNTRRTVQRIASHLCMAIGLAGLDGFVHPPRLLRILRVTEDQAIPSAQRLFAGAVKLSM